MTRTDDIRTILDAIDTDTANTANALANAGVMIDELNAELAACRSEGDPAWSVTGLFDWTGSGQSDQQLDAILAMDECAGLAALVRWSGITNDEVSYNWGWFDRALAAGARADKPVTLMVILGAINDGLPDSLAARLPASEQVTVGVLSGDQNTFPVFWSATANDAHAELVSRLCDRYRGHPNLGMLRVTGFWRKFGEPWIMDTTMSDASADAWLVKFRARFGATKTFADLQAAYDDYERGLWILHDTALNNPKVRLAHASGHAFRDNDKTKATSDPARHPHRYEVFTEARARLGRRSSFQFNSANAISGDYGQWLPACFGPDGLQPGVVGAQPIGGVTSGAQPLTTTEFDTMLRVLAERKFSYVEVYGSDFAEAQKNPTGAVAASIRRYADTYAAS